MHLHALAADPCCRQSAGRCRIRHAFTIRGTLERLVGAASGSKGELLSTRIVFTSLNTLDMASSGSAIKQWETTQKGLDTLKLTSAPMPEPGKDEVLVEIHTVSLNYRDTEGTLHASVP